MIEQRFKAGVRYLWNKPPDAPGRTDGAIVLGAGAVTNLTYNGLDGHQAVIDPLLLPDKAAVVLGLAVGANVPYAWLNYAPVAPLGCKSVVTTF